MTNKEGKKKRKFLLCPARWWKKEADFRVTAGGA